MIVCFGGRILQFFCHGPLVMSRLHVAMLNLSVDGPDRKGRHVIDFAPRRRGHNAVRLVLDDAGRRAIEPLLVELRRVHGQDPASRTS